MAQEMTATQETHTMAIVSLVLGILGVVGVLPLIGSIGALITANRALNEIAGDPAYKGDDLAKIGRLLGWIGLALMLFGILIALIAVLFFVGAPAQFSMLPLLALA